MIVSDKQLSDKQFSERMEGETDCKSFGSELGGVLTAGIMHFQKSNNKRNIRSD